MKTLAIGLALLAAGCALVDGETPVIDTAASAAQQTGGCLRLVCALPLSDCKVRPGRCHR